MKSGDRQKLFPGWLSFLERLIIVTKTCHLSLVLDGLWVIPRYSREEGLVSGEVVLSSLQTWLADNVYITNLTANDPCRVCGYF